MRSLIDIYLGLGAFLKLADSDDGNDSDEWWL
ncbi:hypothetical protein SAMN05216381_3228 [Pseudomonas seleniipraecipitans]|uniref:Uncharacterized protein n=1 Tax=Phytopseudomonas seleniipraecipitans TaxID=640205 RepID=A0A1G7RPY1_9GAMM|nr:hypothetical protein SAMN05216381_3228 [Pseudomonas seleniipraecipitans]